MSEIYVYIWKFLAISVTQLAGGLLLKMLKCFKVILNVFEFSHVKAIAESWLVYGNKFSWIAQSCFQMRQLKKLVPASFFFFLELLREKNKF